MSVGAVFLVALAIVAVAIVALYWIYAHYQPPDRS